MVAAMKLGIFAGSSSNLGHLPAAIGAFAGRGWGGCALAIIGQEEFDIVPLVAVPGNG